jgi:hypothetical protein
VEKVSEVWWLDEKALPNFKTSGKKQDSMVFHLCHGQTILENFWIVDST